MMHLPWNWLTLLVNEIATRSAGSLVNLLQHACYTFLIAQKVSTAFFEYRLKSKAPLEG